MDKIFSSNTALDVKQDAVISNPSISQDGGEEEKMAEQKERTEEQTEQKVDVKEEQKVEQKEKYIPYSRFKEVIEKKNEYEQKIREMEERLKQEEEQKLKEKEEYKTLYEKTKQEIEQYKQIEQKTKEYEEVVRELVDNELEQIKKMIWDDRWVDIVELLELESADTLTLLKKIPKIKKIAWVVENKVVWWQDIPKNNEDTKTEKDVLKQKILSWKATMQEKARYMQLIKQN